MKNSDVNKLNKANKLMNDALKLIESVNSSNKDFKYNPQSWTVVNRLEGAISQMECIEGVLKVSNL